MRPLEYQRILGGILIVMASAPNRGEPAAFIESPSRDVGGANLEKNRRNAVRVGGRQGIVEQESPEAEAADLGRSADVRNFPLIGRSQQDTVPLNHALRVFDHP